MENDLKVHYLKTVVPAMMKNRGYTNLHQVPKLEKIVLNCSVGSLTDIKVALEDAVHDLTMITGQKPIKTKSKKSISNFNLRLHQEIGCKVTLRGRRMYEFLDRLVSLALPRVRDFRGLSSTAFDGHGNYSLGLSEQMVFPDGMRSSRAYFYGQSAAPTRIVDERTLTAASGNSSPTTVRARLDVYLTGDRVDSSGKMVDNVAKTVQPYEIDNLRRHEREIFARVSTTNSAPRTNR